MTVTSLMTADELFHLADDGYKYELVRGELRRMSPAGYSHGRVAARIAHSVMTFLETHPIGEICTNDVGFRLEHNPDTVLGPDVAFVRQDRVVDTAKYFEGAPDLAIEVVSPNDTYTEVEAKAADWLRGGAQAVIVVDPARKTARIHRTTETVNIADTIAVDDVIPGWQLRLAQLFK